jgi:mitotic spindle assembly checkpoint protein MAD2B
MTDKDLAPLLKLFKTFLAVSLHSLLHARGLYPPTTFLAVRAFNLAAHQSRHPGVCEWVRGAVDAVVAQLAGTFPPASSAGSSSAAAHHHHHHRGDAGGSNKLNWQGELPSEATPTPLARVALLVVHHPRTRAVMERWVLDVQSLSQFWGVDDVDEEILADATEALRGALKRIIQAAERLDPVPEGCTFTVAIELQEDAPVPVDVSLGGGGSGCGCVVSLC